MRHRLQSKVQSKAIKGCNHTAGNILTRDTAKKAITLPENRHGRTMENIIKMAGNVLKCGLTCAFSKPSNHPQTLMDT
jgi:hypothetical protein